VQIVVLSLYSSLCTFHIPIFLWWFMYYPWKERNMTGQFQSPGQKLQDHRRCQGNSWCCPLPERGKKTLSIIWVRFLPRFRLQIYNIYNSKNLKARLLFHLKCTNLGFAKHAIRVIGYYPTKSPSRHHPSLWYGSQSEHRGHRAEHAHRHKFLLPKCQVRIHLIRDHKDAKLLRRLCNLERKRTIDTIANH
jgi:hypothetical protein